jgi:ketosteroid isomerase-like protein
MTKTKLLTAMAGAAGAIAARAALSRAILAKLRSDVAKLNAGDYGPLLRAFADDAVLAFNEGDHRWSGVHRGRAEIERFLQDFTRAGIHGELKDLHLAGPPWSMSIMVRFDDGADAPDGEPIYRNRVAMLVRTRWGRIVHQEDFYEDSERIAHMERRLNELGIAPVGREPVPAAG